MGLYFSTSNNKQKILIRTRKPYNWDSKDKMSLEKYIKRLVEKESPQNL